MAIIYTYPKLQDPQGNELIVVSDVNNKNATRLITIADIASLVPGGGGGGCTSAISGILTDNGNYIPPLCNNVTFQGSGIYISADQASSTVLFQVDCTGETPGETPPKIGGIRALNNVTVTEAPGAADDGTYYPIEVLKNTVHGWDCFGVVRVPDSQTYELPCATTAALGGIKVGNIEEEIIPTIEAQGTAYSLERNANCEGFIRVPSTDPYVLPCANTVDLGGIKVGNIDETAVPVTGTGTATVIEVNGNCEAFVRIPDGGEDATLVAAQSSGTDADPNLRLSSGLNVDDVQLVGGTGIDVTRNSDTQITISSPTAAPGNGQIDIVAGTGLTGGGSFTVNQASNSTITLNAESTAAETGWSPMTITEGATTLDVQPDNSLTIFYHATADATFDLNTIKMMLPNIDALGNANKDDSFSVALYEGSLTDTQNGGPSPTLINQWQYTPGGAPLFGIKEIVSGTTCSITAGKDYVIAVSVKPQGALLLGDGVQIIDQNPGTPNIFFGPGSNFINSPYLGSGNANLYGTGGAAWPQQLEIEGNFSSSWRYSIHFYFTENTERYQYTQCEGVATEQCSAMDPQVVVEGTPSQLADYLVLQDGVGNQCCYVKQAIVPDPPTAGYSIVNPFTDCENLPAVCLP